jgi:hypothetical protein
VLSRRGSVAGHAPILAGPLADHPAALALAREVQRVHKRYAAELVAANRLCPFLRDVETGFGTFVVMLDPGEPSVDLTLAAVVAASSSVVHVVFPLANVQPVAFERFSGGLAVALKAALREPPVMATFHPELAGDGSNAHRLVGVLRRAPDPFVQLIPEGMHEGGTVFANVSDALAAETFPPQAPVDVAESNFEKVNGRVDALIALIADIRADRDRAYAPHLRALAVGGDPPSPPPQALSGS